MLQAVKLVGGGTFEAGFLEKDALELSLEGSIGAHQWVEEEGRISHTEGTAQAKARRQVSSSVMGRNWLSPELENQPSSHSSMLSP